MSRKRPRKLREVESIDKDSLDRGAEKKVEEKEQTGEEYDAFGFIKDKKQVAAVAGAFFIVGFLMSWFVNPSMTAQVIGSGVTTSPESVGEGVVSFMNDYKEYFNIPEEGVSFVSAEEENGLITIVTSIQGTEIPIQSTTDGKNVIFSGVNIENFKKEIAELEAQQTQESQQGGGEIPKSDRPVVDLFIWSYCPYGVLALGPLADVASLFADKAEFNTILYYAGHGDYETQQNKIQACIQKIDKDKYWEYAKGFVEEIYPACSRDVDCDKNESARLMDSLGIDSSAVLSCVDDEGEDLIAQYYQYARSLGVTGSPTFVINGAIIVSSSDRCPDGNIECVVRYIARDSESIKQVVCSAFNTQPEECSTQLDSGGGSDSQAQC